MTLPNDLSKLLGNGENPNGMVAQTANGTVRVGRNGGDGGGDGHSYRYGMADGPMWNQDPRMMPDSLVSVTPDPIGVSIPRGRVAVSSHTRKKPR